MQGCYPREFRKTHVTGGKKVKFCTAIEPAVQNVVRAKASDRIVRATESSTNSQGALNRDPGTGSIFYRSVFADLYKTNNDERGTGR